MSREAVDSLDPALKRRVLAKAFKDIGIHRDATMGSFDEALKVVRRENSSKRASLPGDRFIADVYGDLVLGKKINDNENRFSTEIGQNMVLRVVEFSGEMPSPIEGSAYGAFDSEDLKEIFGEEIKPHLRGRRPGDMIKLPGGTKKLQDLLVDRKIPRDERNNVLIAALGSQALLIKTCGTKDMVIKSSLAPYKDREKKGLFVEITVDI